jgi:hypothetical protein
MIPPQLELYLLSVRALSLIDELEIGGSIKKAYRTLERTTRESGENLEYVSSEAHARAVHNFNVVLNAVDSDVLEMPIGELKVEK